MNRNTLGLLVFTGLILCAFIPVLTTNKVANALHLLAEQERQVIVKVRVKDDKGDDVSGAHVNVYVKAKLPRRTSELIAIPPDYQSDTNSNGLATIPITVKAGAGLSIRVEVGREDMDGETQDIDYGLNFPAQVLAQFFLHPKAKDSEKKPESTTTLKIHVSRKDTGDPVEGANIEVWLNIVPVRRRIDAVTDANGDAVVVTQLWNDFEVRASKQLLGKTSQAVRSGDHYQKEISVELSLEKPKGSVVVVNVRDEATQLPVVDAKVILDGKTTVGYYSETTDNSGTASLTVPETGKFAVRISQEYYEPLSGAEIDVTSSEQAQAYSYTLTPKEKESAKDSSIQVTVLAKDPTDPQAKPTPLAGAMVKAGNTSMGTDADGHVRISGNFDMTEYVTVEAPNYKSQSQNVTIHKTGAYPGRGSATFILEPELSENMPLRLIVEVHGVTGEHVKGGEAQVEFFIADGTKLVIRYTNPEGEAEFRSSSTEEIIPVAVVRRGMFIVVKSRGYKEARQSVPADLLKPSFQPTRYLVQLDKDWSQLASQIAALEARVSAWVHDKGQAASADKMNGFIDKALAARKNAEQLASAVRTAHNEIGVASGGAGVGAHCQKADPLQQDIITISTQVHQKADELKKILDEANSAAAKCETSDEAESVRSKYRTAIKLVGEIGALNKKAVKDRNDLAVLAQRSDDLKRLIGEMQKKVTEIRDQGDAAQDAEKEATDYIAQLTALRNSLLSRQMNLKAEFAVLSVKFESETSALPPPAWTDEPRNLKQRLGTMEQRLSTSNDMSYNPPVLPQADQSVPASITEAVTKIYVLNGEIQELVQSYNAPACDIDTLDGAVEAIGAEVTGAMIELSAAGDLPKVAADCIARAENDKDGPAGETLSEDGSEVAANKPADTPANRPPVEEIPEALDPGKAKTPDTTKPGNSSSTGDGGFWNAAKTGKREVEKSVAGKPAPKTTTAPPVVEEIPDALDPGKSKPSHSPAKSQSAPVVEELPDALDPGKRQAQTPTVEEIPEALDPGRAQPPAGTSSPGAAPDSQTSNKPKKEKKPRDPNKPSTTETVGKVIGAIAGEIIRQRNNKGAGPGGSVGANTGGSGGSTGVGGVSSGGATGPPTLPPPDWGLFGDWVGGSDTDDGCPVSWEIIGVEKLDERNWRGSLRASHSCPQLRPSPNAPRFPQLFGAYQGTIDFAITGPGQLRASMRGELDRSVYVDGTFTDTRNPSAQLTLSDGRRQVTFTRRVKQ